MTGRRLAVVGTGLIGTSVALAGRAAGLTVTGFDTDEGRLQHARALGALDAAAATLAEAVAVADTVVVATPAAATPSVLRELPPMPAATLVTDVASVKEPIIEAAAGLPNFVGGHPIAGNEGSGPAAAHADLFRGRQWALVPSGDAALDERAGGFVRLLGAEPFEIDAGRHDALIAFTSHLPQLLSTALGWALAERLGDPGVAALCGPGMRSMLRLAASPWQTWEGILALGGRPAAQEVRGFAAILRSVADAVEQRDGAELAVRFGRANAVSAGLAGNEARRGSV